MSETPAVSRRLLLGGAVATGALAAGMTAAAPAASATGQVPRRRPGQKSMIGVPFEVDSCCVLDSAGGPANARGPSRSASRANVPTASVREKWLDSERPRMVSS